MIDKGEVYIVFGESGEYSSYSIHPVQAFFIEQEAEEFRKQVQDQVEVYSNLYKIIDSMGFSHFRDQNGNEISRSPMFYLIDSLAITLDPDAGVNPYARVKTEYIVKKVPDYSERFDQIAGTIKSAIYLADMLDDESRKRFLSGDFSALKR